MREKFKDVFGWELDTHPSFPDAFYIKDGELEVGIVYDGGGFWVLSSTKHHRLTHTGASVYYNIKDFEPYVWT